MTRRKQVQPTDDIPAAIPDTHDVDDGVDMWRETALDALSQSHSSIQEILQRILNRPSTLAESTAVNRLGGVREKLWRALRQLANGDVRFDPLEGGQ